MDIKCYNASGLPDNMIYEAELKCFRKSFHDPMYSSIDTITWCQYDKIYELIDNLIPVFLFCYFAKDNELYYHLFDDIDVLKSNYYGKFSLDKKHLIKIPLDHDYRLVIPPAHHTTTVTTSAAT
jgi:hypothetical protein